MTYEQFLDKVLKQINERLGGEYRVRINSILKNNSVKLDGLVILSHDEKVTPNIYLNEFYDRYMEGEEIDDLIDNILCIYQNSTSNIKNQYNFDFDFESMKEKIYYRIINYSKNQKLLNEMPHIRFLDLAVTFHCLIRDDEEGIGSIRITTECLKNWKVTVSVLMKYANRNTPFLFPPSIRSMDDAIGDLISSDPVNQHTEYTNKELQLVHNKPVVEKNKEANKSSTENVTVLDGKNEMYIVSNTRGINGASVMLYKNVIRNFALLLDSDFYILPSSIHEIILVPYKDYLKKEILEEMVFDINHTQLAKEEVLSNQVYYYNRKRNAFEE